MASFRDTSEEFNKAAKDLPRSGRTSETMLTRYELLLKHKAQTDAEKTELVRTLYECGRDMLKVYSEPGASNWITQVAPGNIRAVFVALRQPESLKYLPEEATRELADIALDLLTKADNAKPAEFSSDQRYEGYIKYMVAFARTALETADAWRDAAAERTIDIKTGKNITPAKRLVLKQSQPPHNP